MNVGALGCVLMGFSTFCGVLLGGFSVALVVVRTAVFSLSVRGLLGLGGSSECCSRLCIDD